MLAVVIHVFFGVLYLRLYDFVSHGDFDVSRGCDTKTWVYKSMAPVSLGD